jgi:predicted nuclease of restriction endonuclease-like (RecB) superfamily
MKQTQINDIPYSEWLRGVKERIRVARVKVALAANNELLFFYFDLGKMMDQLSTTTQWGNNWLLELSKDLRDEFPDMEGFSKTNLYNIKRLYQFYREDEFFHQLGGKIPWRHHVEIFTKSKSLPEAYFYISETIENGWSRDILGLQIKSDLYQRQGKSISNFKTTLPEPLSDLAQQSLKDPYVFDFLTMTKPFHEKDIERQLMLHITKFLLELGKGFAFVGQQYQLEIGETNYFIDLLFYHIKLKCYVVIELKNTKFIPEYAGKLNFYLSAVDTLVKSETDQSTIGILLCRDKNNFETEFALRDINKPMGVSEFQLTEILPDELKSSLPSVEELEKEFNSLKNLE